MGNDPSTPLKLEEFLPSIFHLITAGLNQQFLERLRPYGVTVQRWRVLMVIMNKGARSIGELVKLTLIPQSALSRLIDQMERDGLVTRQVSRDDSRVVQVAITDYGREIYWTLAPAAVDHAGAIVANFSAAEVEQLRLLLGRVLVNLDVTRPSTGDGTVRAQPPHAAPTMMPPRR